MDNEILVEQGLGENFKNIMQKVYNYLDDCNVSLDGCSILEELGFDNGDNYKVKNNLEECKNVISVLLSSVNLSEDTFLEMDNNGLIMLEQIINSSLEKSYSSSINKRY